MRTVFNSRLVAFVLFGNIFCSSAENIDKPFSSVPLTALQWRPGTAQLTYLKSVNGARGRMSLYAYDAESGTEKLLYDPAQTSPERGQTESGFIFRGYQWNQSGDSILVSNGNDYCLLTIPSGKKSPVTTDGIAKDSVTLSPDGKLLAFVRDNNLYVADAATGKVRALTADGSETILNATQDWVYEEELREGNPSGRAFAWSPDSKKIAYLRLDQSAVPEHPIVNILMTHPTLTKQRYPKSGDPNSTPEACVAVLSGAELRTQKLPIQAGFEYILPEFVWTPDSKTVAVTMLNRAQNELTVFGWNPADTSEPKALVKEKESEWVNVFGGPAFISKGATGESGFVWLSERDGWAHAYLYGIDGTLTRQVTHGNWMIESDLHGGRQPFEIDAAHEWIYFSATEKDPRERQLYRARLDGTGNLERLTKESGTHTLRLAPDGKYILESYSSVTQPPLVRLLRADGTVLTTLYRSGAERKSGSEFVEFNGADGTTFYARMTKPGNFDAAKKYPVVVYIYGGPHVQVVRNVWSGIDGVDARLAQDGCLIWSMDNRGSWGRGHAWETAIYKNMGAQELADQLAGIEYLKKLPFVDASRIGIHGWSYGGYMTLYSLTHAPDVFKCGCAGAPVTDWKYYDTIYTERYMRTPADNPDGYVTSSPLAAAAKLKAKLLIIHGTSDDNVHIQNTMNFLDALTKANRPYELQIQPGQKHGFRGEAAGKFLSDRMVEFFKRNL
ncbi:MAG TPA: DPP IV N-terminal domain-containing protein [Planctomycetota bacterium]|nr:DPP IV N-terminal domain-containing protein [Planctomycetota bacterium]